MLKGKSHWTWKGKAARVGSGGGTMSAGTVGEFYRELWCPARTGGCGNLEFMVLEVKKRDLAGAMEA
jgi:hypothetical protein